MSIQYFHEIRFMPEIAYGASGGPEFFTDVITSSSGFEQRNINWMQSRNRYNLAPAIKTKEQLDYLLVFFRLSKGKAIGFRFKDWADYQISKQEIAVADGKRSEFQIIKKYDYGGYSCFRKITKPVINTIKTYIGGKLVFPIVDEKTGVVKFHNPPPAGSSIQIEGEFDVAVRFDTDHLITSIENYGAYSHHDIPLIELKI